MTNLILIVISIALMSAITMVGFNHIPVDAYLRQAMQTEVQGGIQSLEGSVVRYLNNTRDGNGNLVYPGDGLNLLPTIAPMYGFIPADPRGELTWAVSTGQFNGYDAVGICVHPVTQTSDNQKQVLSALERTLPVGSSFLATSCNASADEANGDSLTYWIVLNHLN